MGEIISMPRQRLYYDYVDKLLIPYIYVLTFKPGEIKWDKPVYYYDAITPFNYVGVEDLDDSLNNAIIYFSDFIFHENYRDRFGLNLNLIKKRIKSHGVDPYVINQLILPTNDISKLLSMIPSADRRMDFVII